MAKFNVWRLSTVEQEKLFNKFYRAVAALRSTSEVRNFFTDLLEMHELAMFSRRIIAAQMLSEDRTYDEIGRDLGMGADTIARVHSWLQRGSGYKTVINRTKK